MDAADVFRVNVRQAMDEKGLSMTDLAKLVGTQRPNISRILSGQEAVTLPRAERIATALRQPLVRLLIESPDFSEKLAKTA